MGATRLKFAATLILSFLFVCCNGEERKPAVPFSVETKDVFVSGFIVCSSNDTPCAAVLSGSLSLKDSELISTNSEAVVLRDGGFLSCRDSKLESFSKPVVAVVSSSTNVKTRIVVASSSLHSPNAPLFYVKNSNAAISLRKGACLNAGKELLVCGSPDGGESIVSMTVEKCAVSGAVRVESGSSCNFQLQKGSDFSGILSKAENAKLDISMEKGAHVVLKGDWHVTTFKSKMPVLNFIDSNGYTIFYDADADPEMNSRSFPLNGGGMLMPEAQK